MKQVSTIIRWLARILGALIVLLVLFLFVSFGYGLGSPSQMSGKELASYGAIILMVIGALAAWKWEAIGGLVILASFAMFLVVTGSAFAPFFLIFPLAGCLHLIAWRLDHKLQTNAK